ncbi:GNAT family N-acetyltransferase [Mollicutes bacterium LVI A0039]|nr:GNAT family N-acetyltransferase [Mollicutes bacterium LVI A0039]
MDINFSKLKITDIPLIHKWVNTEAVIKGYSYNPTTIEETEQEYIAKINKVDPVEAYLIEVDNVKIGYVQIHRMIDFPKYYTEIGGDDFTAGFDIFIGENEYLNKGYGTKIIYKVLEELIFSNPHITNCIILPTSSNSRAIKAYQKSGFTIKEKSRLDNQSDDKVIMKITEVEFNRLKY